MNGAVERGNGPLIHHRAIEIPSLADVQQARHFKLARVGSTHAGLNGERLVPIGDGDGQANSVEAIENRVGISGGELLNGVVNAGHGLKEWWTSRPVETTIS